MANFIGMVFATLKDNGIDTTGMSTDEAVKKYNELKDGMKDKDKNEQDELTENEKERLTKLGIKQDVKPLTKGQKTFFAESKAKDEDGNLITLYHGTKTKGFEEFRYDPKNQTGDDYGEAYYFTTSYRNAKGYAHNIDKDPRIEEYSKVKNDLIRQFVASNNEEEKQKLKKQILNVKVEGKTLYELMQDVDYDTGGEVKEVYLNIKNPLVFDAKGEYYYKIYDDIFSRARASNNDGIIIKNTKDNSAGNTDKNSDVYVVFKPNQIKSTTNKNPTNSNNINK